MPVFERAGIGLLYFLNNLGDPIRTKKGRTFALFDFSYLLGDQRAAVHEGKQFFVYGINLDA